MEAETKISPTFIRVVAVRSQIVGRANQSCEIPVK
jgi:hypothetical protein